MKGLTLDDRSFKPLADRTDKKKARSSKLGIAVPAAVIAQVWRSGARQATLAKFLGCSDVETVVLDGASSRACGQLCGQRKTKDIVDASVVVCAKAREHSVVTSDIGDLQHLDSTVPFIRVP